MGAAGAAGTTYAKLIMVDGGSADLTTANCLTLPLKAGGRLPVSWTRFSGMPAAMTSVQDTWMPAGVSGIFGFLPLVTLSSTVSSGRRRVSTEGTLNYSAADVPDGLVPCTAVRTTTYWTEYDQRGGTYFEYFAGSSLLTTDPMFGRLNRIFDTTGNTLSYVYGPNAGGKQLLRKISGLGGNVVPYFAYANETIDATHFAPITTVLLANTVDATQNRSVYFEYASFNSKPYLSKVVYPTGCVRQFVPYQPFDSLQSYRIGTEVDPEGYATYFKYSNSVLTSMIEPDGRITYYQYLTLQTNRAVINQPQELLNYQTDPSGNNALVSKVTDPLGRVTRFTNDTSIGRMTAEQLPNGNLTYYSWVGGGSSVPNRYALGALYNLFLDGTVYFDYAPGTYLQTKEVGPRNIPGVFPVVTYWEYDPQSNQTLRVDPLGNKTYYGYDQTGMRSIELSARGYVTYFNYNLLGQLQSLVDAEGGIAYYDWNDYNDRTRAISPRWVEGPGLAAFTTFHGYDDLGRPLRTQDPLQNVTYYEWTGRGDPLSQLDALGTDTLYSYDSVRLATRVTVKDRSGNLLTETYFGYNNPSDRVRTQDALGNITYFNYDLYHNLTSTSDPLSNRTYFFYDLGNNISCRVDKRANPTYFFYDPLSRLTAQRDALGYSSYYFYDKANNRTCAVDAQGRSTYYFYDQLDRENVDRDALGSPTYFYFDEVGNRTVIRDARGNSTYFFYDGNERQKATRDSLGDWTYFSYDAIGNLTRVVDPLSNTSLLGYDALDRLQARQDALGAATYFYFDGVGNTTATLDPRKNPTYFFYDGLSRLSVRRDALGNCAYYFYDALSNQTRSRDPRGNATYFFFDALSRMSVRRDVLANATYFFYDAADNLTNLRDARGNTTYFFFDALNRRSVGRDALGAAAYYFYDEVGQSKCVRDARGNFVYFVYDAVGRLSEIHEPEGKATLYTYDSVGNLTKLRLADTSATGGYGAQPYGSTFYGGWSPADSTAFFDSVNRVTAWRDALGGATYFFYDAASNRTVTQNPLGHAAYFGYDALHRICRIQDAIGSTTYFEFDLAGNPTKVLDADLHALQTRFDTLNRPDSVRMPDGGSAYFFYDEIGSRSKEVDARGNATYYGYDALSRAARIQNAIGMTLYFEYDSVSNLSKSVDAEGSSAAYTYDAVNRRTATLFTAAGSAVSASLRSDPYYAYDEVGNVTQMGDLWGLHRMGYDGLNRALQHQFPQGQVVYYEYGPRHQVNTVAYPGTSGRSGRAYDALLRQTRVQAPSGATAYFSYDAASNLSQRIFGNSQKLQATYDAAERLRNWRIADKNGAALTYFDYARDAKGLITKAAREANYTTYYLYDANDRLTVEIWANTGASPSEVYGFRYAYDAAGNRTKQRINGQDTYYFYDQANQLTVSGTDAAYATPTYYTYDKNGSLTDLVEPTGTTKLVYNAAGLVARLKWKDASATYFFYDGALQRFAMVAAGTAAATYFLWDGPNLLQELNPDGTVKEEHTNAQTPVLGIGQLVETNRPGQTQAKLYPIQDPRGTITKWIQSDGTTVFAAREYDSFGNLIPNSAAGTWPGRLGYQGQVWLEILNGNGSQRLMLSPTRIYDPATGRFLQNEPLLKKRPFTHYLYASQNPVSIVDPLGLQGTNRMMDSGGGGACQKDCDNMPTKMYQSRPSNISHLLLDDRPFEVRLAEGRKATQREEERERTFWAIVSSVVLPPLALDWKAADIAGQTIMVSADSFTWDAQNAQTVDASRAFSNASKAAMNAVLESDAGIKWVESGWRALRDPSAQNRAIFYFDSAMLAPVLPELKLGRLLRPEDYALESWMRRELGLSEEALQYLRTHDYEVTAAAWRLNKRYRPKDILDPRSESGCEKAASRIEFLKGRGERFRIKSKVNQTLGKYRGKDWGWSHHDVVVIDGRVYDAFTGWWGEPIEQFQKNFTDWETIHFGF